MEEYKDGYEEYAENAEVYEIKDWRYGILTVLLLAFIGWIVNNQSTGVAMLVVMSLVLALAILGVTGYNAKGDIKLYQTKEVPSLDGELKGTNYLRDGIALCLSFIPYLLSLLVYNVIGIPVLLFVNQYDNGAIILVSLAYIMGLSLLPYFTYLQFTLVPYILATNKDITAWKSIKLSYDIISNDEEARWEIFGLYFETNILAVMTATLLFVPLYVVVPDLNCCKTELYLEILAKQELSSTKKY